MVSYEKSNKNVVFKNCGRDNGNCGIRQIFLGKHTESRKGGIIGLLAEEAKGIPVIHHSFSEV